VPVGISEILFYEFLAVQNRVALIVFDYEFRVARGHQQVLTVNPVTFFGKKSDITGGGGADVQYAKRVF